MTCDLTNPIFTDEAAAVAHMEADRWPNGVVTCPLCGVEGEAAKMGGKTQAGMFLCNACRGKFTVRTGSVFERSHIPLHKWLLATHLMASSKKGISAHQLHRMLGITYKSAWFMAHRIRTAMTPNGDGPLMGSEGGAVEIDETYIGRKRDRAKRSGGMSHKMKVLSLVDRTTGEVRSRVMGEMHAKAMAEIIRNNVSKKARMMTDEANFYTVVGREYAEHSVVKHGLDEYVRGDTHTNTIEGVFSVFKRGMVGTYQHCSERHLPRYVAEFDFRYSNREKLGVGDAARAARILKGAEGKRLTYRQPH